MVATTQTLPYVEDIRKDFPVLKQQVNKKPLVYLDNAATTQKPQAVIDKIKTYYETYNSNVHRGIHTLSQKATDEYEAAREYIRAFINAPTAGEIILTKGTTEGINLVANAYGRANLNPGDEVLITEMEHHSDIVPWQLICEQTGATLKVVPVKGDGSLDMEAFRELLTDKTKIVAVVHISNALGTVNPVKEITTAAHDAGAVVLIDGAQSLSHTRVDVQDIGCDFFVTSAHKAYGPTGTGFLFARAALSEAMPPYHGGGDMIDRVTFEKTTYAGLPHKFEAGTPNIAGVLGFAEALKYIERIGYGFIRQHENDLLEYATEQFSQIDGLRILGTAPGKTSVVSFLIEGTHPTDLGTLIDFEGVAVRTGHHCTQPLWAKYDVPGTCRASFGIYNTRDEIDTTVAAIRKAVKMLR